MKFCVLWNSPYSRTTIKRRIGAVAAIGRRFGANSNVEAMRTLVVQSFRRSAIPLWIARCLASVEAWAWANGFDYELHGDEAFALCGDDYLRSVGDNVRSITNLARLELLREAHRRGYDRAIWLDADVLVFDPERFKIPLTERYAFARETWVERAPNGFLIRPGANNCALAVMRGEPDLDMLIALTRHVALHRTITSNYQVGGDIVKGLRSSLAFATLDSIGMFSPDVVVALGGGDPELLATQAREFGSPVFAANLAAGSHYLRVLGDDEVLRAMDCLEATRGDVVNRYLTEPAPAAAPAGGMIARLARRLLRTRSGSL
jgi:hypothetical protein